MAADDAAAVARVRAFIDGFGERGGGLLSAGDELWIMAIRRELDGERSMFDSKPACCEHHAGWADAPSCEDEQRERAEAALADALSDDRMDSLPSRDVLDVAQAMLGWLAEDGWELWRP